MRAIVFCLGLLLFAAPATAASVRLTDLRLASPVSGAAWLPGSGGGVANGLATVGTYIAAGGLVSFAIGYAVFDSFDDGTPLLVGFALMGVGVVAMLVGAVVWGIGAAGGGGGDLAASGTMRPAFVAETERASVARPRPSALAYGWRF